MPIYSLAERRVELHGEHHFIAPDATLVGDIVLENNVNVWFKVVIRGDNDSIVIGESTNFQEAAVLHVDQGYPMRLARENRARAQARGAAAHPRHGEPLRRTGSRQYKTEMREQRLPPSGR